MDNNYFILIGVAISFIATFGTVYALVPPLTRFLNSKNLQVHDVHIPGNIMIARPGGPAIISGIVVGCVVLYSFLQHDWILAVMATTLIAFIVGLIDDLKSMGGWFKPIGLVFSAIPLLIFGTYGPELILPLFGALHIPVLYIGVVILGIVLIGNTINSIDVFSGLASGIITISSITLGISLVILENYDTAILCGILALSSFAYYRFHKIPCTIFPGDSGVLAFGAMYGAIAITGGVEIIAAIALLPAIIESFLYLSGTKRIVEHKKITKNSTDLTDDFKMRATFEKGAVPSLVGIILADGKPLTESQLVRVILGLSVVSSVLAIITTIMMRITIL